MRTRSSAVVAIAVVLLLTAGRCDTGELSALKNALSHSDGVSGELLSDAKAVKGLSGLSSEDRALQRQLLVETDQRVVGDMDLRVTFARAAADTTAAETVQQAVVSDVRPEFVDDLTEVTKEMVKEAACQQVLDQVSPAPKEPGVEKQWTDEVGEVIERMVLKGWDRPQGRGDQYIDWARYLEGVAKGTQQVASGLLNGSTDIELFARPPVQRAALAYARYCYATPRMP